MDLVSFEELKLVPKITSCFVDLDNTLWSGILAEGQSPDLFKPRYEILEKLYRKGIQIYIISKNDRKDVDAAFKKLKINDDLFTWVIANWEPKYLNISNLIRVCDIRPETALFIDDNPFERNEVKQHIPEINVLDADNIAFVFSMPSVKDKKEQTEREIKERQDRYRSAIKAESLRERFTGSDIEFYRKLKRMISFGQVPADNLDRATRLLTETHRLNFNPGKFANLENAQEYIHERFNAGDMVYAMAASEGKYSLGLTGVFIVHYDNDTAIITDGSFSCGIIGRDFEPKALLILIDGLKKGKINTLKINFCLTATNMRLKEIVEQLGFKIESKKMNEFGVLQLVYVLGIRDYTTEGKYDWIAISNEPITFEYAGHPYVINFFNNYVRPLFFERAKVLNLGSARGEVLGFLQKNIRDEFTTFLENKKIVYTKVDMEYLPEENNLVANAEDLSRIVEDGSEDIVMAVELLEHTQKPWLIISEMSRVCKTGGYIFISVPSFNYAKHEYPIDLWRFGPKTLGAIFNDPDYRVVKLETEGDPTFPRRTMILVEKTGSRVLDVKFPSGKIDDKRGVTVFD